jgi:hypothetical protein
MKVTIALSWFHRRLGPILPLHYPENTLQDKQKKIIADLMDQPRDVPFSYSFGNLFTMNYYFEIPSLIARGKKEMVMISVITSKTAPNVVGQVFSLCIEFSKNIKNNKDAFWAFYDEEGSDRIDMEKKLIKKNRILIENLIKKMYYSAIELVRQKSEEEKIALLMSQKSVYEIFKFLSNGPVSQEDLANWFQKQFPDLSLQNILLQLENERFIFINDIRVEIYVLLVKNVNIERIPPYWGISLSEQPELNAIIEILYTRVQKFFDNYNPTYEDEMKLLDMVANSSIYNVLSKLRNGPQIKSDLLDIDSKEQMESMTENLKILKENELIDYVIHNEKTYVLLQNDIRFTISFPDYLIKLIPKEIKPYEIKPHDPT